MKKILIGILATAFALVLNIANTFAQQSDVQIIAPKNQDGSVKTFEQVLKGFEGKVVYVDFWASWCGPCRSEFPHSKKLHQSLEGKDVVFLYVSLDSDATAWENAIKNLKLTGNHLLPDPEIANALMKKYKISGIPRYMVFDKAGKVIDTDAPRPSSAEIKQELESYIAQ